MRTFLNIHYGQFSLLFTGLFLLASVQGCVEVNVGTSCPPNGPGPGGEPTACQSVTIVNPWPTDNNTFNRITGDPVPNGSTCKVGGKRCKSTPGKCTLGGPNCKTWFTPTANPTVGDCVCDCP